jgi:fatty acid-binding protein DegV
MLHVVMDSAGDLPAGWAETYAIQVIPINIHFGEQMFRQGIDLQAALASLLNVKPVIILREGVLELGDRVRTRKRSLEYIVEIMAGRIGEQAVNAAVVHSEDPEAARQLQRLVAEKLRCKELITTELSIGVAANLGPGAVGIIAYPVEEG